MKLKEAVSYTERNKLPPLLIRLFCYRIYCDPGNILPIYAMSLFHMNIKIINKNLDGSKILYQLDNSFDFVILTETWRITDTLLSRIHGFQRFYNEGYFNPND